MPGSFSRVERKALKAWKGGKGREGGRFSDRHLIRREMDTHVSHILSFPSDVHVITLLQRIYTRGRSSIERGDEMGHNPLEKVAPYNGERVALSQINGYLSRPT